MPDKDASSAAMPLIPRSEGHAAGARSPADGGGTGSNHEPNQPGCLAQASSSQPPPAITAPSGSYSRPSSIQPVDNEPRAANAPDLTGMLLGGKYRLVQRLSEGGMGNVWVAHHEALDAEVAVKVLRRGTQDPTSPERFHREARAAAKLGHPAIVRVLDYGHNGTGEPYIVMERLRGEDLRTRLARSLRLPAIAAVRLLLPVAHAIAAAHEKGIVHRDIKPENIFLSLSEGSGIQPKLVDFGIATMTSHSPRSLTLDTVVGSPGYMSPEQARGEEVDHRTDIWSFCIVLYETIAGRPPFIAPNYNAVLREVIERDPVPLVSILPDETELWALLERGLAKNRRQRWPSMRVLGIELAQWLLARGVSEDATNTLLQSTWMPMIRPSDAPDAYVRTMNLKPSALRALTAGAIREAKESEARTSAALADPASSEAPVSTSARPRTPWRGAVAWTVAVAAALALAIAAAARVLAPSSEPEQPAKVPSPRAHERASAGEPRPAQHVPDAPARVETSGGKPIAVPSSSPRTQPRESAVSSDASTAMPAKRTAHTLERPRSAVPAHTAARSFATGKPTPPAQATSNERGTNTDLKTSF